jgi:hypothetical protein
MQPPGQYRRGIKKMMGNDLTALKSYSIISEISEKIMPVVFTNHMGNIIDVR